jgi:nicotinamidase-related amidase
VPVIYTRAGHDPKMAPPEDRAPYLSRPGPSVCVRGEHSGEIVDELAPGPEDHVVDKVRSSAFYGTRMEALLRVHNRWIVVAAGGSTNWGIEWLARDAKARDILPVALRDCTYSGTDEAQAASLANIDDFIGYVLNADEVERMLTKG